MNYTSRIFFLCLLVLGQAPLAAMPPNNKLVIMVDENHPSRIAFERGCDALKVNNFVDAIKYFKIAHGFCSAGKSPNEYIEKLQYGIEYNIGALRCLDGPTKDLDDAVHWLSTCLEHINYNKEEYFCASALFFLCKAMWEKGVAATAENEDLLRQILYLGNEALLLPSLGNQEKEELGNMLFLVSGSLGLVESSFPATEENQGKCEDGAVRLINSIKHLRDRASAIDTGLDPSPTVHLELQRLAKLETAYERGLTNCYLRLGEVLHCKAQAIAQTDPRGSLTCNADAYKFYTRAQDGIVRVLSNYEAAQDDFTYEIAQIKELQDDVKTTTTAVSLSLAIDRAICGPTIEDYTRAIDELAAFSTHEKYGERAKVAMVKAHLNRAVKLISSNKRDKKTVTTIIDDLTYAQQHANETQLARNAQSVRGMFVLETSTNTKDLEDALVDICVVPGEAQKHVALLANAHLTLAQRKQGTERTNYLAFAMQNGDEKVKAAAQKIQKLDSLGRATPQEAYEMLVELTQKDKTKSLMAQKRQAAFKYAQELAKQDPQKALSVLGEAGSSPQVLELHVEILCAEQNAQELLNMLQSGDISKPETVPAKLRIAIGKLLLDSINATTASRNARKTRKKNIGLFKKLINSIPKEDAAFSSAQSLLDELRENPASPVENQAVDTKKPLQEVQAASVKVAQEQESAVELKKAAPTQAPVRSPEPAELKQQEVPVPSVQLTPFETARTWLGWNCTEAQKREGVRQLCLLAETGSMQAFIELVNQCIHCNRVDPTYLLSLLSTQAHRSHLELACEHAFGSGNQTAAYIAQVLGVQNPHQ